MSSLNYRKELENKAILYERLGFVIHPLGNATINPTKAKIPVIPSWNKKGIITRENCIGRVVKSHPENNVGLITGTASGVFVLDLDKIKEKESPEKYIDGVEEWDRLCKIHGDPRTPIVLTPSGGRHVYFKMTPKIAEYVKSGVQDIIRDGKKVKWDLFGDDARNGGGKNVVLPPSRVCDENGNTTGKYEWKGGSAPVHRDEIKEVPDWLFNLFPKKGEKKARIVVVNDEVETGDPSESSENKGKKERKKKIKSTGNAKQDAKQLLEMLSEDRCDDYSDWLSVGMALKNIEKYSRIDEEWAFELWDEWSQKSSKYDGDIMEMKWESFGEGDGGITMGTLRYFARQDNPTAYWSYVGESVAWMDPDDFAESIGNIFRGERGHSDIIYNYYRDTIIVVEGERCFRWDDEMKIWTERSTNSIVRLVCITLEKFVRKFMQWFKDENEDIISLENAKDEKKKEREGILEQLETLEKLEKKCQTSRHACSVWKLASPRFENEKFLEKLNMVPHLLPINKGRMVDLKTGKVRERNEKDYFSFECNVDVGDGTYRKEVEQLFADIMASMAKTGYLRDLSGACLTGELIMRQFFILWGEGSNGKSLYINIMKRILGRFFGVADRGIFIKDRMDNRHAGAASPHIIALQGKRLCVHSETEEKAMLNDNLLKTITGGDLIGGRSLYSKSYIEFYPQCKLITITNNRPEFKVKDKAFVDRLRYVPFNVSFVKKPRKDNPLEKKMDVEVGEKAVSLWINDIFSWMLEGAINYYKIKDLPLPKELVAAKDEYIEELNTVKRFMMECTEEKEGSKIKASNLYDEYCSWCSENECNKVSNKEMANTLKDLGYISKRLTAGMYIMNISLINLEGALFK